MFLVSFDFSDICCTAGAGNFKIFFTYRKYLHDTRVTPGKDSSNPLFFYKGSGFPFLKFVRSKGN